MHVHDDATAVLNSACPGTDPDGFWGASTRGFRKQPVAAALATHTHTHTSTTWLLSPLREHFALVAMQPPNVGRSFQKPTRGIEVRGRMIKSTWWRGGAETRENVEDWIVSGCHKRRNENPQEELLPILPMLAGANQSAEYSHLY